MLRSLCAIWRRPNLKALTFAPAPNCDPTSPAEEGTRSGLRLGQARSPKQLGILPLAQSRSCNTTIRGTTRGGGGLAAA